MADGFLASLNPQDRAQVLRGSSRFSYPAGAVAHREGAPDVAAVVETGLVRIFVQLADGRQASVAYLHRGDTYAVLEALWPPGPGDLQAVTDTEVLLLNPANIVRLMETNLRVAGAGVRVLGRELSHLVRIVTVRSLGSMTERLAFDLLERACQRQLESGQLQFAVTHAELADSIGSTREVVSRIIADLRRSGVVATSPGRIRVLDAPRLSLIVRGLMPD